jgi:hypothetical protein
MLKTTGKRSLSTDANDESICGPIIYNRDCRMSDHLKGLNPKQREAVEYGIRPGKAKNGGPLLVIAGAGSGKTKTLVHRVAHLIANGADPHKILLLTFSRRAATEMTGRVRRIAASVLKNQKVNLAWRVLFTISAPGCCGSMPMRSAGTRHSPSTTAPIRRT